MLVSKCIPESLRKKIRESYGRLQIARYGFWFVDIPRTSSSSIRAELAEQFGRTYGKRNILEKEYFSHQVFVDHLPAREMRVLLGSSIWENIFTFTVVRNPWDRIHSLYNYRKMTRSIPQQWSYRDFVFALEQAVSSNQLSKTRFGFHAFRYGASEYVLGENGELIVDYVAKYENREHDLKTIASRLNLRQFGELCIQSAAPKKKHYSQFYDSETREIIRKIYAKDIELFGYEFDNKA